MHAPLLTELHLTVLFTILSFSHIKSKMGQHLSHIVKTLYETAQKDQLGVLAGLLQDDDVSVENGRLFSLPWLIGSEVV